MTDGNKSTAAFFDFDETLLAIDSGGIGFKVLKQEGYLSRGFILKMAATMLLKKAGLVDELFMANVFLSFYRGRHLQEFIDSADAFYTEYLQPNLSPEVTERLRWHQKQGHTSILVSGAIDYYLKPVQADLGIDHLLCTYLEQTEQGTLTGKADGPVCVGENKVILAKVLAEMEGLDLTTSFAYGNSWLDIPILENVGNPVVVNPDNRLARHARKRGWEFL